MKKKEPKNNAEATRSDEMIVVGLGASAGGVEALTTFFESVTDTDGIVFVVVVHMGDREHSALAKILQKSIDCPVISVEERTRAEAAHIYVIPPGKLLSWEDGDLVLTPKDSKMRRRSSVNYLFCSLCRLGDRACGIVLSGGGDDGGEGLRMIREKGGLTMAQDPAEALQDSMPSRAIEQGVVDFILPAAEMAGKVSAYRDGADAGKKILAEDAKDGKSLDRLLNSVRKLTGHDFSNYKRSTILRRIARRMSAHRIEGMGPYHEFLKENPEEAEELLKSLLISVTHFFRDAEAWKMLSQKAIPELFEGKSFDSQVRVWVPACATGEEAYSLAILLNEYASGLESPPEIQIFATDLDEHALHRAREGVYPKVIASEISNGRLKRFFIPEDDKFRVKKDIRERILFASHSVLRDPPFSRLGLISCRNLLIYLNRELQRDVLKFFYYGLEPDGLLFLGNAESTDATQGFFEVEDKKFRLFRRVQSNGDFRLPNLDLSDRKLVTPTPRPIASKVDPTFSSLENHRRMLEEHAPPSIIVNSANEIQHLSDGAGRFLRRPGGTPSNDILKEVIPELRLDLQTALHRAFDLQASTGSRPIDVEIGEKEVSIFIIVQPGSEDSEKPGLAMILFAEVARMEPTTEGAPETGEKPGNAERERRLDGEIELLRSRLETTVSEYELSREEMKAGNEELQSINEEYKSMAEELETSKEELQSVNEELATLNQELKSKVDELSHTNSDLQNLMAATEIGTLFLDKELHIQRYTPRVAELFRVLPTDKGRPITHITHNIDYDDLEDDARKVLRDLSIVERRVAVSEGFYFLIRLRPYRTIDDRIEGVVITFVDITEMQKVEDEIGEAREYAEQIVDTVRHGLLVLDDDELRVQSASKSFYELFGLSPEETLNRKIFDLENGEWDIPRLHDLLERDLPGEGVVQDYEIEKENGKEGKRILTIDGRRMESRPLLLLAIEDTTDRKRFAYLLSLAEQTERRRLAGILHDDLQQILGSARMRLELASKSIAAGDSESATEDLSEVTEAVRSSIDLTRGLTAGLSPPLLADDTLEDAMVWLAAHMSKMHGLEVTVDVREEFNFAEPEMRDMLTGIVRELLFNVVKHAGIEEANIEIARDEDEGDLVLTVSDGGFGFDPEKVMAEDPTQGGGFGLRSIRERLRQLHASFEIVSSPGEGAKIVIRAHEKTRAIY